MSISAISSAPTSSIGFEKSEGPGPDVDNDGDEAAAPAVQATPAPGTGAVVDKTA